MIETRLDANHFKETRVEVIGWEELPVYGPKTFLDTIVEPYSLTEIRTTRFLHADGFSNTVTASTSLTSIRRSTEARGETYSLTETRTDIYLPAGLVVHSTDTISELIRLSGNPPDPLTAKQAAETNYEENPMPGNVVTQANVNITTVAARVDTAPLTGRIRVRITNMGDSVIYVAATQNFCVVGACDRVEPLGGTWEQYWTESVQVWAVAASGATNPAILTQTASV